MRSKKLERLRPQIEAALVLTRGVVTYEDVVAAVDKGTMQPWIGPESVAITEILGGNVLHIFLAAGKLEEIEPHYPLVEAWARERGCTRAICTGRPGWERTFLTQRAGWTPTLRVYEKTL
jgi:hypothetical protein